MDYESTEGDMSEHGVTEPGAPRRGKFAFRYKLRPTERELIMGQLLEAKDARRRASDWIAKSLVGAIVLAILFGNLYLAAGAVAIGVGAEVVRQIRLAKTIRKLWRALRDPMDGS